MARDPYINNAADPKHQGDVEAAMAAGAALGTPLSPVADEKAGTFTVVPRDYELKSLAEFLPRPLRIAQEVVLHDAESLIAYVNSFKLPVTRVFFSEEEEQFIAILDYHENETAAWCGHTAAFRPRRSVEFTAWMDSNRKQMSQVDFARFLEENLPDIKEPNSAELLQVALLFEAKKTVEFSSGVRLQNGQIQFTYTEEVRNTPPRRAPSSIPSRSSWGSRST